MKKITLLLFLLPFLGCNSEPKISPAALENLKREMIPAIANNELFKKIAATPQEFSINSKKDTTLVCKNGTAISIPRNCFTDENGNEAENVKIKVVEALSMDDFLKNNLQTSSNGKLLESAGMLYIDASSNNKPLALKDSSSLHIEMPTDFKGPDYKVFTGKYDSAGNMRLFHSIPFA